MADLPLDGVTILDLTWHVTGPYCTKLLADYGAEVIKIERPGSGDPARAAGPFPGDLPHPEKSGLFLHLNSNKKSVTLDLATETGRRLALRLAENADAVIESFQPGVLDRLGLGYAELQRVNPDVVLVSISNFGQTGPYRNYKSAEIVAYAMGSTMFHTGLPDREPLKLGGAITLMQAGSVAAVAAMGALTGAWTHGAGQHADVSIHECQLGTIDRTATNNLSYQFSGSPTTIRRRESRRSILPAGVYPCADGYVQFVAGQVSWWPRFCRMVERPDLIASPRYTGDNLYNMELAPEVDEVAFTWLLQRTKLEVMQAAQAVGFAGTAINTVADLFTDPHFADRGYLVEIDHPETGPLKYPGAPWQGTESRWRAGRAPLLGEHNRDVLCGRLGLDESDLAPLRQLGVI
ncbi:MAG: CoA transferase [Chloroflexi bacterium]|nr:CoA transferase [Chloroflexota bacterium]